MQFREAKDRLKQLADGKYHSINYSLAEFSDGSTKIDWRVYIGDAYRGDSGTGDTFEKAFAALEDKIKLAKKYENERRNCSDNIKK